MRNTIRLRKDLREQVKSLLLLQKHHQQLAAQHEAQLAALLKAAYGIDIAHENWSLDADTRVLSRVPDPTLPAPSKE